MRLIMFGTGPFAVPTFVALLDSRHDVSMLVTRPVTNSGNRRKSSDNPTRDAGIAAGIEVLEPASANEESFISKLQDQQADLLVVCDYGEILSNQCLASARLGGINLHGSLLPKYRGAAPINWAIYQGETRLGVTVIHMTSRLDGGNCLTTASLDLGIDETAETVEPKLAILGIQPVLDALDMIETWDGKSVLGVPQDKSKATRAPRLDKKIGLVDWARSATAIRNQVRAFKPWPGTYTNWTPPNRSPLRIIIHQATVVDVPATMKPGQVAVCNRDQLVIQTGEGGLSIERLQPAGKRDMPIADFLRGYQPQPGDPFF